MYGMTPGLSVSGSEYGLYGVGGFGGGVGAGVGGGMGGGGGGGAQGGGGMLFSSFQSFGSSFGCLHHTIDNLYGLASGI